MAKLKEKEVKAKLKEFNKKPDPTKRKGFTDNIYLTKQDAEIWKKLRQLQKIKHGG